MWNETPAILFTLDCHHFDISKRNRVFVIFDYSVFHQTWHATLNTIICATFKSIIHIVVDN